MSLFNEREPEMKERARAGEQRVGLSEVARWEGPVSPELSGGSRVYAVRNLDWGGDGVVAGRCTDCCVHSDNFYSLWCQNNWAILTSESSSDSAKAQTPQVFQETTRLKMYRFNKLILCKQIITAENDNLCLCIILHIYLT